MELTERRDLRGGRSCWKPHEHDALPCDPLPQGPVDVAIIGAGVMGAMLAERLAKDGRRVALLDRRPPAHGSTAASTALVMWSADVPLTHLSEMIGADEAVRRWRRMHAAVRGLSDRIDALALDCGRRDRPELYLTGTLLDERALEAEGQARRAAGLPSTFLAARDVTARFGIAPRAALLSADCYELDPVRLTQALLSEARQQGATISFPHDVAALEQVSDGITVQSDDGSPLLAGEVILATGYERARWFLPPAFAVTSTYAIATSPGVAPLWRENAMIWEASDPYLYARATADGRIIVGGEDEHFAEARQRDALIGTKAGILQSKIASVIGGELQLDCAWAAAFGTSPDGLPAIGRAANHEHLWLASGFGGNGITFAALAAELIAGELACRPDPDISCFDPYRFGP